MNSFEVGDRVVYKPKFEVGDRVVYNPKDPGLAPNTARPRDIGIVTAVTDDYVSIRFDTGRQNNIPRDFVTHYSQSKMGRHLSHRRRVLANIPNAVNRRNANALLRNRMNQRGLNMKNPIATTISNFLDGSRKRKTRRSKKNRKSA